MTWAARAARGRVIRASPRPAAVRRDDLGRGPGAVREAEPVAGRRRRRAPDRASSCRRRPGPRRPGPRGGRCGRPGPVRPPAHGPVAVDALGRRALEFSEPARDEHAPVRSTPTAAATPATEAARAAVSAGSPAGRGDDLVGDDSGAQLPGHRVVLAGVHEHQRPGEGHGQHDRGDRGGQPAGVGTGVGGGQHGRAPRRAQRQPEHGQAHSQATSGPSRATASMKSMTIPSAVLAASSPEVCAATAASTMPPTSAATPSRVRITPGPQPLHGRLAERLAGSCAGRAAGGQQAREEGGEQPGADGGDQRDPARPQVHRRRGSRPCPPSWPNHQRASATPGRQPARPASGATSSASVATVRRICRGVAPMARSRAISRARWPTASATVPAAVKTATAVAMPPKEPPMAMSISLAPASAAPRRRRGRRRCGPARLFPTASSACGQTVRGGAAGAGQDGDGVGVPGWPDRPRCGGRRRTRPWGWRRRGRYGRCRTTR